MGDSNKQVCQLCLDKAPASECETIDEIKKAMLQFLLINISFDESDCVVACNICVKRLQESCDFKSRCGDVGKVLPRVMMGNDGSIENISLGSFQVCCLCMSSNECDSNYMTSLNDGVLLKEMIKYCFPEMDLRNDNEPAICKPCINSLKGFHEFLKNCREVEGLCQLVIPGTADIPILEELPISEDIEKLGKSIIIKKESSDVENVVNTVTSLKNEDIATIKCEELDIKDESDTGEEMDESVTLGACNNNFKTCSLKRKRQIRKSASKGRNMLGCHILKPRDKLKEEIHKCVKCAYETIYKSYLVRHMITHRDRNAERKFKCDKCPYETDIKSYLRRHNLIHKDKSELEMYKCENCDHETRYKSGMILHMQNHRDPKAKRKFQCEKCTYETDRMYSLRRHNLTHKDKSEVELHKCNNCEYENRCKENLIKHMRLKHRDHKAERKLKCDKCPYETDFNYSLRIHNMRHKDKSEVVMYKCENCEYETRYKNVMIRHKLRHRDPRSERKFKCGKCPYETDFKYSLRMHNQRHKDKSEVEIYKCGNCKYETRYKRVMIRHKLRHRDPKAERKFKCDKCPYETDFKVVLRRHNLRHKDKSEVEMHKCENCEFKTRYKSDKTRHMLKHCDVRAKEKF